MGINPDLKLEVREELGRLQFWEDRRRTRESEVVAVGDTVYYKDYKHPGIVTELLDGLDNRRDLVARSGAMVSFKSRPPLPVFLWALRREPETRIHHEDKDV